MKEELIKLYNEYLEASVEKRTHMMSNLDTGIKEPILFKGDFNGFIQYLESL